MKPRTQAGRALFNRHAWRLEDSTFAEDIAAIEREASAAPDELWLADVLTAFHLRLDGYCSESHRADARSAIVALAVPSPCGNRLCIRPNGHDGPHR